MMMMLNHPETRTGLDMPRHAQALRSTPAREARGAGSISAPDHVVGIPIEVRIVPNPGPAHTGRLLINRGREARAYPSSSRRAFRGRWALAAAVAWRGGAHARMSSWSLGDPSIEWDLAWMYLHIECCRTDLNPIPIQPIRPPHTPGQAALASRRTSEPLDHHTRARSKYPSTRSSTTMPAAPAVPLEPPPIHHHDGDDDGLFADSSPNLTRIVVGASGPDRQHASADGSLALETLRAHGAVILRDSVPRPLLDECRAAVGRVTSAIVADAVARGSEGGGSDGSGFDDPKVIIGFF